MTDIKNILISLQEKYDAETNTDYLNLYSKMSVIEFCGWIEVSFDEIWKQYLNRVVSDSIIRNYLIKAIDENYGFEYSKNIQKIFCLIIGGKNWQNLLSQLETVNRGYSVQLKSILNDFTRRRNSFAHTTIGLPITFTYDSPSIVLNNYDTLYKILVEIENYINTL